MTKATTLLETTTKAVMRIRLYNNDDNNNGNNHVFDKKITLMILVTKIEIINE